MTEAEIRAANPTWTDEQVATEVARLAALPPATPPAPPEPVKPEEEHNRAMAAMRREAKAAEARAKAAEEALAERDRKEAEERGEWQKIAEKAEADKVALQQQLTDGEAKAAAAVARSNALQAATDLKFKDPGYALYKLEQQSVDYADAAGVKAALDALALGSPDLLAVPAPLPPSGGPPATPPPPAAGAVTREQIKAMGPSDLAALRKRDPAGYRAALQT